MLLLIECEPVPSAPPKPCLSIFIGQPFFHRFTLIHLEGFPLLFPRSSRLLPYCVLYTSSVISSPCLGFGENCPPVHSDKSCCRGILQYDKARSHGPVALRSITCCNLSWEIVTAHSAKLRPRQYAASGPALVQTHSSFPEFQIHASRTASTTSWFGAVQPDIQHSIVARLCASFT